MKKADKVKVVVDDKIPLRGVVKCHCSTLLTGAPPRDESGKCFYYYKCKQSRYMSSSYTTVTLVSVTERQIKDVRNGCYASLEQEVKTNKKKQQTKNMNWRKYSND